MVLKMNISIIACDRSFDIGCRVILWDEKKGIDFQPYGKYTKRNISFNALSKKFTQFTVHWSVTYRAKHMEGGLIARGLSCNFMIDDNKNDKGYADIYQCLPLQCGGWSQGGKFNALGPGVEISYMPQYFSHKGLYSPDNRQKYNVPMHKTITAPIHGTKLKVFLPTKAQINSLKALIWGYTELFPHIPSKFPRDSNDKYITTVLKQPEKYVGLVNHYNLKREKIDTAGLDLQDIEKSISSMHKWGY